MASDLLMKPDEKRSRPSINAVIRQFWNQVKGRLVKVHRIPGPSAARAITTYRRRVGKVALNQGEIATAADIAHAIRRGGFAKTGSDNSRDKV